MLLRFENTICRYFGNFHEFLITWGSWPIGFEYTSEKLVMAISTKIISTSTLLACLAIKEVPPYDHSTFSRLFRFRFCSKKHLEGDRYKRCSNKLFAFANQSTNVYLIDF